MNKINYKHMKHFLRSTFTVITAGILFVGCKEKPTTTGHYPIEPVPFTSVQLTDRFWSPRIRINFKVTIPIAIDQCYSTGRVDNFKIAGGIKKGHFGTEYPFDDTDIYKLIEAASYSLQTIPDAKLEAQIDSLIYYVGQAQEEDGYLYTNRTIDPEHTHPWAGKKRWVNAPELSHELYDCGHLYEAAVAHYQATGKTTLLNIAEKNANLLLQVFGPEKLHIYPGHQIVEMALVRLYNVTGKKEYLDLAKFFLDVRGTGGEEYNQAHKKVVDQTEPVGHAVRATYMYSGMADIAAMYNDPSYINAVKTIWKNLVTQKTYITGGIGSGGGNEGFDPPYVLPNMSAYCETCSSVGDIFWNKRMFLYDGDSKYYDVLERTLYNSFLSGVSLSGDRFFYPNVLESFGQHSRSKWFGCACCPPNVARLLPSLPGYIYAKSSNELYVNLFIANKAEFSFMDSTISLKQTTNYPWNGKVEIQVTPPQTEKFTLKVRIPGWARNEVMPGNLYTFNDNKTPKVALEINGEKFNYKLDKGYAVIHRKWSPGDVVSLDLPMEVRQVIADKRVEADHNKMAIERGPLVYCAEWPYSKEHKVLNLVFDKNGSFMPAFNDTLLNGVEVISAMAQPTRYNEKKQVEKGEKEEITLIPYYAWNNKGPGEMTVWLPFSDSSVRPMPAPTIASKSKVSASVGSKALIAINDQYEPKNSIDRNWPYFDYWPKKNSWEWIQYDFNKTETISSSKVYWFDDGPFGGCRIPAEWKLEYKSGNKWTPVDAAYPVVKDNWSETSFKPVSTNALRLMIKLPEKYSSGVHEWTVK
jgi:uncharacterized protein